MGLLRLIILVLVVWLLWRMYQIHKRKTELARKSEKAITGGKMVKCAHCGTHLPEQSALPVDELWYCCKAHRNAAQEKDSTH